jgi:hypothetical protein
MLGIKDPWILAAYVLCILSAILCVVYGIYNWNKGADISPEEISEELKWDKEESEINENL